MVGAAERQRVVQIDRAVLSGRDHQLAAVDRERNRSARGVVEVLRVDLLEVRRREVVHHLECLRGQPQQRLPPLTGRRIPRAVCGLHEERVVPPGQAGAGPRPAGTGRAGEEPGHRVGGVVEVERDHVRRHGGRPGAARRGGLIRGRGGRCRGWRCRRPAPGSAAHSRFWWRLRPRGVPATAPDGRVDDTVDEVEAPVARVWRHELGRQQLALPSGEIHAVETAVGGNQVDQAVGLVDDRRRRGGVGADPVGSVHRLDGVLDLLLPDHRAAGRVERGDRVGRGQG